MIFIQYAGYEYYLNKDGRHIKLKNLIYIKVKLKESEVSPAIFHQV